MIEFRFEGDKVLIQNMKKKGSAIANRLDQTMWQAVFILQRKIVVEKLSGQVLRHRTGHLARSITSTVRRDEAGVVGRVGTNVKYAKIHEFGGIIRPKRAQWLTIPMVGALTRAGAGRGRARDFADTFFKMSSSGNLILFQRQPKGILPLFILKKEVKIPERPYFRTALKESHRKILSMFRHLVKKGLKTK